MARYSIYLNDEMEKILDEYMKKTGIKKRLSALKNILMRDMSSNEYYELFNETSQKLNRLLHRQSMCTKLLEQHFVNMGFPYNENVSNDKLLKEFYDANNRYGGRFYD